MREKIKILLMIVFSFWAGGLMAQASEVVKRDSESKETEVIKESVAQEDSPASELVEDFPLFLLLVGKGAEHDPRISAALKRFEAQMAGLSRSKREAYFPMLNLNGDVGWSDTDRSSDYTSYQFGLTLSQPLFDYSDFKQVEVDALNAEATRVGIEISYNDFVNSVLEATVSAMTLKSTIKLSEQQLALYQSELERMKVRHDLGVGSSIDVLNTQTNLKQTEFMLVQAQSQLNSTLEQIQILTNIRLKPIHIPSFRSSSKLTDFLDVSVDFYPFILHENLEVKQSALNEYAAESKLKQQDGRFMPSFDLYANYSDSDKMTEGGNNPGTYDMLGQSTNAGIKMSMSLFASGANVANKREYQAMMEQSFYEREFMIQQVDYNIRLNQSDVHSLRSEIGYLEKQIETREAIVMEATMRYDAGTYSLIEVLRATNDLFDSERMYQSKLGDLIKAQIKIKLLINQLNVKDIRLLDEHLDFGDLIMSDLDQETRDYIDNLSHEKIDLESYFKHLGVK